MKMTKNITEIKEELVNASKAEVMQSEIMIGFYENLAKEQDEKESAATLLKVQKLKDQMEFSNKFIKYVESL